MEYYPNKRKQNCFDCLHREGKECLANLGELTLEDVDGNILIFKNAEDCDEYESRIYSLI